MQQPHFDGFSCSGKSGMAIEMGNPRGHSEVEMKKGSTRRWTDTLYINSIALCKWVRQAVDTTQDVG